MKNNLLKYSESNYITLRFCVKYKWGLWVILALLGGHFLTLYREPVKKVIIISEPNYMIKLSFWMFFLFMIQWASVRAVRYLYYFLDAKKIPYEKQIYIKMVLFCILFVLIFPYMLIQLTALVFSIQGLYHLHPSYLDMELALICIGIIAFGCFLFLYHDNRMHRRLFRKKRIARQIIKERDAKIFTFQNEDDIERTFMFIRKGDSGFRLRGNGTFVTDHRRPAELREMLRIGYLETSKGVYINKRDVVKLDIKSNKVYLSIEKEGLLFKMMEKYPRLRGLQGSIKSKHGLLFLSPVMYDKIKQECGAVDNIV